MATVITAGCGISYEQFDKWPTWPKYCEFSHECRNFNVGGPAAGNEHIARSITRAVLEQGADCVIVAWTNPDKLDVYVESAQLSNQVHGFPTRNFVIDYRGKFVAFPGNWPSSNSYDNPIKNWYKDNIESLIYYYIRTLESILSVQMLCKVRNIPCHMFLAYELDQTVMTHPDLQYLFEAIDWSMFDNTKSLECDYHESIWFEYCSTQQHGMVPVAGWHWNFYTTRIIPILDRYFQQHPHKKFWKLEPEILRITQDRYEKGIS